MNAFERLRLFGAELPGSEEVARSGRSRAEAELAQRRAAVEDNLRQAASLLDDAPGVAAALSDEALWRCVEAWRLLWRRAPDPEEDALAGIERYAPLLALRLHAALCAADPRDRLRGCVEVFRAVFGSRPRGLAPLDDWLDADAGRAQPGLAVPAMRG